MINYGIYSEQKLIIVNVTGTLNVDYFLSFAAKLRTDSRHNNTFKGVCDFRGVETTLGLDEVQQFVDVIAELPGRPLSKLALLVDTDDGCALLTPAAHEGIDVVGPRVR